MRSEEHTSELQSHSDLVCRLLLEKKKKSGSLGQSEAGYAVSSVMCARSRGRPRSLARRTRWCQSLQHARAKYTTTPNAMQSFTSRLRALLVHRAYLERHSLPSRSSSYV